ncbi:hypothetical protein JKP88DRAFT_350765 [Tribonema minus]|uniref:Uncharacterized protein n=1 Tax=Tribonema minus TaxID=303371 RepID=A0A835YKM9_9STRA|nr:hypothetical protein JKP88DRAFT_350765 [Tribonema minus]
MQKHYQRWHTKEGMESKIRKQDRLRKVLEGTYAVDSECHIRYKGGCVPDPDKFCSRLDFHVVGITNAIVIVECDENEHNDYVLRCELSRMEQAHEGVIKGQFAEMKAVKGEATAMATPLRPVVFVRYNPDCRMVDGVGEKRSRASKEADMMSVLSDIESGVLALPHPLNLVYVNYSTYHHKPVVSYDPDFSPQMRACIVQVR